MNAAKQDVLAMKQPTRTQQRLLQHGASHHISFPKLLLQEIVRCC